MKTLLALWLLLLASPLALHAQAPSKIFVASYGADSNDGSRGSPKRNFQQAHDAVAAGGQIVVLDTAGYGALNITKSLAVTVPPGVNGFVTVTGNNDGITINAAAVDSVSLRGLIIEGSGSTFNQNGFGIRIDSAANVAVEDCTVRNFGAGILQESSTSARLYVRRCTLRGCDEGLYSLGGAAVAQSAIATDCAFEQNNSYGVVMASFNTSATLDVTLRNCVVAGTKGDPNAAGILSQGFTGAPANAVVVRVDNCRITGNNLGVDTLSGGVLLSRGNNTLEGNTNNNTFPATYSAK
jgi:parallel beta helix pectate lyase-like protein